MTADLSKTEIHIFNLPGNRIEFRLRFTPDAIFAVLEVPAEVTRRRDRRMFERWQKTIHRRVGEDPRPFNVAHIVEGRGQLLALHNGENVSLFLGGVV